MEFVELAATRRSVRVFGAEPVDPATIEQILETATRAPSAHNRQPWRFAVLSTEESRLALARAMGERLRSDRTGDGDDPAAIEADVERSETRITGAPVAVLVCLTMEDMDEYPDERRSAAERTMAEQGAAMAGQNMLLATHALGLGGCWMCAPLFVPDTVRTCLNLPESWEPQGLVLLGHPASEPRERLRRPLGELVTYR